MHWYCCACGGGPTQHRVDEKGQICSHSRCDRCSPIPRVNEEDILAKEAANACNQGQNLNRMQVLENTTFEPGTSHFIEIWVHEVTRSLGIYGPISVMKLISVRLPTQTGTFSLKKANYVMIISKNG
jgi:hypothetical protein